MLHPKISIISPSYNQGQFIEDSIISVLRQEYPNFEHIIIDGGSTDNTIEILKKYPHLIWISEKDKGQSDAINKGFNLASGDIIGWLNTDDYYLEGTFQIVLNSFAKTSSDVIYGDVKFVNKYGELLRLVKSHLPVKWLSLFHCYIHSAAFFFKKEVLDAGIRIDPDIHISMDKDFFANIFFSGYSFKYISETLTAFRWHENNKSIDTIEVKKIRYKEGLGILLKYCGIKTKITPTKIQLYSISTKLLLPLRRVLRLIS